MTVWQLINKITIFTNLADWVRWLTRAQGLFLGKRYRPVT